MAAIGHGPPLGGPAVAGRSRRLAKFPHPRAATEPPPVPSRGGSTGDTVPQPARTLYGGGPNRHPAPGLRSTGIIPAAATGAAQGTPGGAGRHRSSPFGRPSNPRRRAYGCGRLARPTPRRSRHRTELFPATDRWSDAQAASYGRLFAHGSRGALRGTADRPHRGGSLGSPRGGGLPRPRAAATPSPVPSYGAVVPLPDLHRAAVPRGDGRYRLGFRSSMGRRPEGIRERAPVPRKRDVTSPNVRVSRRRPKCGSSRVFRPLSRRAPPAGVEGEPIGRGLPANPDAAMPR